MKGINQCAMSVACEGKPADHGLMCRECRAEDEEIHAGRRFSDDVQPDQREPKEDQ
jgi:hypothetical protein